MYAPHPGIGRSLSLACASLAVLLSSCGGYGSGYNAMGAAAGATCGGTYSVACPPPSVSVTAPAANATVSGMVTLTATATASSTYNLTIMGVEFEVDGASVATVTSSPYTFSWDSTKVANGNHTISAIATDSASDMMTSTGVSVNVQNPAAATAMAPAQLFPTPASHASGVARVAVERESGGLSGNVAVSGMSATSVTLNEAFAGASGDALLALVPRAGEAGVWDVPAGAQLTAQQMAALDAGKLYVIATSSAYPNGEIRGQLTSGSVRVTFTTLAATHDAVAALGSALSGWAATTVDTAAGTLTVHVSSSGLGDSTAAAVTSGSGAALAELRRDAVDPGHWSTELKRISAADLDGFNAGDLTVSLAASAAPQGALRGQIEPEASASAD
jgi:Big-like domain-containing protein/CHRD domain-containing protein